MGRGTGCNAPPPVRIRHISTDEGSATGFGSTSRANQPSEGHATLTTLPVPTGICVKGAVLVPVGNEVTGGLPASGDSPHETASRSNTREIVCLFTRRPPLIQLTFFDPKRHLLEALQA